MREFAHLKHHLDLIECRGPSKDGFAAQHLTQDAATAPHVHRGVVAVKIRFTNSATNNDGNALLRAEEDFRRAIPERGHICRHGRIRGLKRLGRFKSLSVMICSTRTSGAASVERARPKSATLTSRLSPTRQFRAAKSLAINEFNDKKERFPRFAPMNEVVCLQISHSRGHLRADVHQSNGIKLQST